MGNRANNAAEQTSVCMSANDLTRRGDAGRKDKLRVAQSQKCVAGAAHFLDITRYYKGIEPRHQQWDTVRTLIYCAC